MDLYDQLAQFARMSVDRGDYDIEPAAFDTNPDPFLETLEDDDHGLVVELRVPEPSMGRIPKDMDASRVVREMLRRGACAVGVMTEKMKFGGNLELVGHARQGAPVVMRDFVVDPVQVQAAHHAGASAVTLTEMFQRLGHADLDPLLDAADDLDLETVTLVHDLDGADAALEAGASILGVVQQDPVTRERDPARVEAVLEDPPDVPVLVVGGVRDAEGYRRARELGAQGVWVDGPLVGHDTPWEVVEAILA